MPIVTLPMYDLDEVRELTDAWWSGIATALRAEGVADVPPQVSRGPSPHELWCAPDLLLSQSCGYPLIHEFRSRLRVVATPCYAVPGCAGADYSSVLVIRDDVPAMTLAALRDRVVAFNGTDSHSGYNVLRATIAPLARKGTFFSKVIESGSHEASLALVANRRADIAAIDCVTHALLARYRRGALRGTKTLEFSMRAPALPYVTSTGASDALVAMLRRALVAALNDPRLARVREGLFLTDMVVLERGAYARIDEIERVATKLGYPELR